MAIRCPYCAYTITVKNAKPGRYSPKCPQCAKQFSLIVPADPSGPWLAKPLPTSNTEQTVAPPAKPPAKATYNEDTEVSDGLELSAQPKKPPRPSSVDDTEVTGAFESEVAAPAGKSKPKKPVRDDDSTEATGAFESDYDRTAPGAAKTRAGSASERTVGGNKEQQEEDEEAPPSKNRKVSDIPDSLGGYEVIKELGRGGMGAVYLARQVSLDRPVALKVMNSKWASDPVFLARFTREAYAAAQLVHHNVVQIYDIGAESGTNFFSMEFVEGKSLGDMVKKQGKMEPQAAIGYVIQAARGLKFAHDRGMIHRDIKPDNLMLNNLGIVKVADLGLVKTPTMTREEDLPSHTEKDQSLSKTSGKHSRSGLSSLPTEMTNVGTAMGSPSYMSPEQCRDASAVDHRADIYSLGCTLYALLTGKPPFTGASVQEVLLKHTVEDAVPVDQVDAAIPKEAAAICAKMLVKDPARRFQTMDEVVQDCENYLAQVGGKFTPGEEHLQLLEQSVENFNSSKMAKTRRLIVLAFAGLMLTGAIVGCFTDVLITTAFVSILLNAIFGYFVISGIRQKSYLFRKSREVLFGSRLTDWLILIFGFVLFHLLLFAAGLLWVWLGGAVLGIGLAIALSALIDRKVQVQRQAILDDVQHMFKRMRLRGFEEDALRQFVARYSGDSWEAFYEALFGFEAKLAARSLVEKEEGRKRHGTWREPLIRKLESILTARREAKERKFLQAVEAKKLQAEGVDKREAEEQAEAAAAKLVEDAAEIKAADAPALKKATDGDATIPRKKINVKEMLAAAEKPAKKLPKPPARPFKAIFNFMFSWKPRFIIAALFITLSFFWVKQNLAFLEQINQFDADFTSSAGAKSTAKKAIGLYSAIVESTHSWRPLQLPVLQFIGDNFFASACPLVAGLILLVSLFFRGFLCQVCFLAGATVALAGHLIPLPMDNIGPLNRYHMSMIAGVIVAIVGVVLFRNRGDD